MSHRILASILPLALAAVTAFAQSADTTKEARDLQKEAARLDREARSEAGHQALFESLSKQLNVPVATLQAQQKSTSFGFGELFIANALAASTGRSFDQVSQDFKSGKGWGEIARDNNVKLGAVVSDLKRANKQIEKERMDRGERTQASGGNGSTDRNARSAGKTRGAAGQRGKPRR